MIPLFSARAVTAAVAGASLALGAALLGASTAQAGTAGSEHLPDLETLVPANSFSVVGTGASREFRYTHLIYNSGPGPLEIQPEYDQSIGGYRGRQQTYTHDSAGRWSQVRTARVPDLFEFHAEHGHFHFPLATFGLYAVAADGGPGAPVAVSPKVGFCIDDSYLYDSSVEHAGTFIGSRSSCADPSGLRGISVGGADEYDYRDPGQAIPFDGVPDGTYWFRAMTDPNNDFAEADESNNETDVQVTVRAGVVTAGQVRHPDTTPPTGSMSAPVEGASVAGTVPVTVTAPSPVVKAELVVDGAVVGTATATSSPFTVSWDTRASVDGTHWLTARLTDSAGRVGNTAVTSVRVSNATPPGSGPPGAPTVTDRAVSDGRGTQSATVDVVKGGDLVLAFVAADGPDTGAQSATVAGSGLSWQLVRRANAQFGASEVWKATVPTGTSAVTATSTLANSGFDQSLQLTAYSGSAGVGASAAGSAQSGAPRTALTTTRSSSWIFGVGNDWDHAVSRTPAAGQTITHEWVDSGVGDTFWMQSLTSATPSSGTSVALQDTAPTSDRWNLVAVEVLGADGPSAPDTSPPVVTVDDPAGGATVGGIVNLAATAADNVGVASVSFAVDGVKVGQTDTTPPFTVAWDTKTATAGKHTITASAADAAGNVGLSAPVQVTVDNSTRPALITIGGKVNRQGRGTLAAPAIQTGQPGALLVAFVAMDGPDRGGGQTATVSGGGLTWSLVKRSNTQAGDSEIWAAKAPTALTGAVITAVPAATGYDGSLTVIAFGGASGPGVAGAAGAPTGAPSIYLPAVQAGSWVFAVGQDWDRAQARTPVAGQVLQHQWVDTAVGDTFWVQSTAAPSAQAGLVTLADTAPTTDRWNLAAVEVVATRVSG